MEIKICSNTKIYVVAPANIASGGPELLHQLVFCLRKYLNIDAYMHYIPNDCYSPVHFAYQQYKNQFVRNIEDKKENILIVPEIKIGIDELKNYKNIKKGVWWLSVDNFYLSMILSNKKNYFFSRLINKAWKIFLKDQPIDIENKIWKKISTNNINLPSNLKKINFHLVQSYYARDYLLKQKIGEDNIFYVSDYLNEDFLNIQTDLSKKQNIVVYNPKKGYSFTKKIIKKAKDIKFIPIINMNRQQVIETFQKAKVYIDFGNHPGKDRMPREAAILGCCVITGKRGSAAFYEDVSIPDDYKFDDKNENISNIIDKIKDCFNNFEESYKDFEYYREVIKKEPQKFIDDLNKIFIKEE